MLKYLLLTFFRRTAPLLPVFKYVSSSYPLRASRKDQFMSKYDYFTFKGKKIACFRMETGHMVTKSWLREQGLKIANNGEDVDAGKADVAFILLENSQAEVSRIHQHRHY